MTTPKQIIDILREEYSCGLKSERIVSMINSLEQRLAKDVICKTDVFKASLQSSQDKITLGFPAAQVQRVSFGGREIRKSSLENLCGFRCEGNDIVFDFSHSGGEVRAEYIVLPQPFTQSDFENRALLLGDDFNEIYIYHIISREALLNDDIERLNNFSTLYAQALKELIESRGSRTFSESFVNIW